MIIELLLDSYWSDRKYWLLERTDEELQIIHKACIEKDPIHARELWRNYFRRKKEQEKGTNDPLK